MICIAVLIKRMRYTMTFGVVNMEAEIAAISEKIAKLEQYRDLVWFIANDSYELSYEKAQQQRDDWRKRCQRLLKEVETY